MAELPIAVPASEAAQPTDSMATPKSKDELPKKRGPSVHQIYALPAPIRTFPLPAFYPNNPLSWLHLVTAWLRQAFSPPSLQPALHYHGVWDERTGSVHVRDWSSMRALWEQGFYGKGSFSRSEPNWLKREQVRRGHSQAHVSELVTAQRREERAQAKWERARAEQQAIMQTRRQEAGFVGDGQLDPFLVWQVPSHTSVAPVGPSEILSLPNSDADISSFARRSRQQTPALDSVGPDRLIRAQCDGPQQASFPFPLAACVVRDPTAFLEKGPPVGPMPAFTDLPVIPLSTLSRDSQEAAGADGQNERKTVQFSPVVTSTPLQMSSLPNTAPSPGGSEAADVSKSTPGTVAGDEVASLSVTKEAEEQPIVNIEYLQLMPEEAFFLAFALGVLEVSDAASGKTLSTTELFVLARQRSYFPPRNGPDDPGLEPDDRFLLHYAVYHHFRSLGWVPRGGIKFGVHWLLYTKGPVFDHAEFGLIVMPSYSDARWKVRGKRSQPKTWAWLHSIVRVLSHAVKSLVLVYVDVPPPEQFEEALAGGIAMALKQYRIREVMVKRWSSNRNR